MKIRNKLVSNSSSSSFVLLGTIPPDCNSLALTGDMAKRVAKHSEVEWYGKDPLYLTQFISDAEQTYGKLLDMGAHRYRWGNHNGPYDPQNYVKLTEEEHEEVWIHKDEYFVEKETKYPDYDAMVDAALSRTEPPVQTKNPSKPRRTRTEIIKHTLRRKNED